MNLRVLLNIWFLFTFLMLIFAIVFSLNYETKIVYSAFVINVVYTVLVYILLSNATLKSNHSKIDLLIGIGLFSLFFLIIFKMLYGYLTGSLFELTAKDSLQYHEFALKITDQGFWRGIFNFARYEDIEDLGAVFFISLAYQIYPSTLVFNIFNMIAGIITINYLYKLAINFMSKTYAYYCCIFYGLSSFVIYLYSTGMKETFFVLFVVCFFEKLAHFLKTKSSISLFLAIFCFLSIYFFRPAVMYMMGLSFFMGLFYSNRKKVSGYVFIFPILVVLFFTFLDGIEAVIIRNFGSLEVVAERAAYFSGIQASKFNFVASFISGLIGPLPTYHSLEGRLQQSFYAPGSGMRVLLSLPFFLGLLKVLKGRNIILLAICFFSLFEMLSLSLILESFELRLNSPHLIFIYLIAFYALYLITRKEINIRPAYRKISLVILFVLMVFWNLRI